MFCDWDCHQRFSRNDEIAAKKGILHCSFFSGERMILAIGG